jgi:hypothetical protein
VLCVSIAISAYYLLPEIRYPVIGKEVTLTTKTLEKAIRKYEENPYYYLEESND